MQKLQKSVINFKIEKIKKKDIIWWALSFIITFIIMLFINTFIIINAYIPTTSMIPTIMPGRILANRLYYVKNLPQRKDIVIIRKNESLYVKRILALPGETIEIKNGVVYINNIKIEEPYVFFKSYDNYGPYIVPDNCYFVLGDNRVNSFDSRLWEEKVVNKKDIIAKKIIP